LPVFQVVFLVFSQARDDFGTRAPRA